MNVQLNAVAVELLARLPGTKKALVAVGRSTLVIIWHRLSDLPNNDPARIRPLTALSQPSELEERPEGACAILLAISTAFWAMRMASAVVFCTSPANS